MSIWQPIETAPTGGTRVLTWHRGDRVRENYVGQPDSGYAGLWGRSAGGCQPTHWMPLPNPPEAA